MPFETRKEPTERLAREMAMIACRLNCWHLPLSNANMTHEEILAFRDDTQSLQRRLYDALNCVLDDDHVSWMWSEGEHLWKEDLRILPIRKRFFWPHPYARDAGLLWVRLTMGYRYFVDGVERQFSAPMPQPQSRTP